MQNPNFDPFSTDSPTSSSNSSAPTGHIPGFGTAFSSYATNMQNPNIFSGCYRPQLPQLSPQDIHFQQYQQQQLQWNQSYPQQSFPQQPFIHQPFAQQPSIQPPIPQQETTPQFFTQEPSSFSSPSKKTKKSKKKKTTEETSSRVQWTEPECLTLSKCWIHVSEDPYVSTNQQAESFWYKILDLYNAEWPDKPRTKDALTGKWDYIRTKVNKFNGIYSQLVQTNSGRQSGASDSDVLNAALAEYRMTVGGNFPHLKCWEFLRDKQKFLNPDPCVIGRRNRKRDGGTTSEAPINLEDMEDDDAAATFHSKVDRAPRPTGRNSKSQRTNSSSAGSGNASSEVFAGLNARVADFNITRRESVAEKQAATSEIKRSQRLLQRNYDMDFLRTPTESYPEEARSAIEEQKARIIENLRTGYYDV